MKTRKNYNDLGVKLAVQYMNEDVRYNTPKPSPAQMQKFLKDREKSLKAAGEPITVQSMLRNAPPSLYQPYLGLLRKMYPTIQTK